MKNLSRSSTTASKAQACLAQAAEDAVLGQDAEGPEPLAALCAAVLVVHMLFIFFAEIFDGGKHGVRRAVAETAEGTGHDHLAHLLEQLDIAFFAPART